MTLTPSEYDELFKQIDFKKHPYGGKRDYVEWEKSKINSKIVSYLKSGKILDAGGGYGYLKYFLSNDQIYYNLEYSKEIQKYDDSMYKVIGTGLSLPFKNNTFNNVVSGDVLEHVPDKNKYLEECFRVLKSEGIFVINTPTIGTTNKRYYGSLWFYFFGIGAFIKKLFKSSLIKSNGPECITLPEGAIDEPSEENWLYSTLNETGFTVIDGKRTAVNVPLGLDGKLWRKIADAFIDEGYGDSVLFACEKGMESSKSKNLESMYVICKREGFLDQIIRKISKKLITTFTKIEVK